MDNQNNLNDVGTVVGAKLLEENLLQSEKTIAFLKEQLSILTALAAEKQRAYEAEQIKRLAGENEELHQDLKKLKQDVKFYEVQNGIIQVALPHCVATSALSSAPVKEEEPVVKKAEEKPAKKKDGGGAKGKGGKGQAAPVEDTKPLDSSRLNMRVGHIVSVKKHPDADTLFVEEVNVGEEKNRTVVSGLVKHYTLEQMENRTAVFMCNLKPAKMRGVLSEGMIMCASSPEKVEILQVPQGAVIGDRVTCEGYPGEADPQLNPKKKIWEQLQPDLRVGADGTPRYKNGAFVIEGKGQCKAPSMTECAVK